MQLRKRLASAPQPTTAAAQTRPAGDEQQTEEPQPTAETATGPAVSTVHFTPVSVHIQSKSRGSSQTNAVDQIMEALVASSERHNQLIKKSQKACSGASKSRLGRAETATNSTCGAGPSCRRCHKTCMRRVKQKCSG